MTDHTVAIAGAGPTGLMLLASCRWPASKLSSSNDAPSTRPTGREMPVWVPSCRDTPGAFGKPLRRAARVGGGNEKREARRG